VGVSLKEIGTYSPAYIFFFISSAKILGLTSLQYAPAFSEEHAETGTDQYSTPMDKGRFIHYEATLMPTLTLFYSFLSFTCQLRFK